MTYQEIKDRLTKCELTLEKIKDGSYTGKDITEKTQKLEILKESLQNQLVEAEKGMVATDDEDKAADLADKGVNVKLTSEMKPGSEEAAEHERFKRLSAKDQETINKIRAMMQAEKDKVSEEEEDTDDDLPAIDRMYNSDAWVKAQQDAQENKAVDTEGGDLDVGHQDDEPDMLKQYAYDIATYAAKLYKQLDKYDKMDGEVDFPNWWQSKVILAKDYISKAQHYLEFEEKQPAIDALALEGKVNERLRFLSPEKQKANDAKFEKRMALLKALERGIELHKAGKISDEELHNLKLKAGTISAEGKDMGVSKKKETKFHKDLDTLVHDTFGKREDEMNEASYNKLKKEYDELVGKMKQLAQHYKTAEGEAKDKIVKALLGHTKRKEQLKKQLDAAVSGIGAGQELDANISERAGGIDEFISLIQDRAADSDFPEEEEAVEVIEAIAEHYGIDIEFGRLGDTLEEAKGGKFVVRPCSAKNTPWAVWQTSADGENDKRIKGFKTKPEAQKFADEKNAAK